MFQIVFKIYLLSRGWIRGVKTKSKDISSRAIAVVQVGENNAL